MASRFLFNENLWQELSARIEQARSASAAVAYLGSNSSHLLPLKAGDRLVVDMSLRAVRAGVTDPKEVKKFLKRGVTVFSRASLHAKFFVVGRFVITGSSNISNHARTALDEAAIMTDDPAVLRQASTVFEQLCTEPVRSEYLKRCLREYRPPRFEGKQRGRKLAQPITSNVWIIGGLRYAELPAQERQTADRLVKEAKAKLPAYRRVDVEYTNYDRRFKFFDSLRLGDWLVTCVRYGSGFDVSPPARFLGVSSYARGRGKRRYLLMYEMPHDPIIVSWAKVRRSLPRKNSLASRLLPKTGPVGPAADADALLRLWNVRGKFLR